MTMNNDQYVTTSSLSQLIELIKETFAQKNELIVECDSIFDLPVVGSKNTLYVTKENQILRWDTNKLKYFYVQNKIDVLDGGRAI